MLKHSLICSLFLLALTPLFYAAELPLAKPEEVGSSSGKLDRIKPVVQKFIEDKQTAGVVTAAIRRGKVVHLESFGMMDIDAAQPMKTDAIFRIYSMSKPVTTVAAMILHEEGKFQLDDPVAKFLPEFKNLKVYKSNNQTLDLKRPVTMRDLMRHTAGMTYGLFGATFVDQQYQRKNVLDRDSSLQQMVEKLGDIPLLSQPGTRFNYSVATDVLGRAVEVISKQPLDEFFEQRIFKPLDMKDSSFFVPDEKLARFAANYGPKEGGGLRVIDPPASSPYRKKPANLSGGGGLVSTARDYLRFCQMLLNGGELDGVRILRPETVKLMTINQLPQENPTLQMFGIPRAGVGFGLGFSVRFAKTDGEAGVIGEYGWGGAASTHFWISPKDKLAVVVLQQFMPFHQRLEQALKPVVYEAMGN